MGRVESGALNDELRDCFSTLTPAQKRQVLAYARSLSGKPRRGVPGRALLHLAGSIPEDDIERMSKAIEEAFERVDPNAW